MNNSILFTADDYGMCEPVNVAIEECLAAGVLKNTCVMVNMANFRDAVSLKTKYPSSSVGIHWNITQGKPISPLDQVRSLINERGDFLGGKAFRNHLINGLIEFNQVELELNAQTELYRKTVGEPSFWNTHQDFHIWPTLFNRVTKIAGQLDIRKMRCHNRIVIAHHKELSARRLIFWIKGMVIAYMSYRTKKLGICMPDGLICPFGYRNYKAEVEEILKKYQPQQNPIAEYVIHPATRVDSNVLGNLRESRVKEYFVFRNPSLLDSINQLGYLSISFDNLK